MGINFTFRPPPPSFPPFLYFKATSTMPLVETLRDPIVVATANRLATMVKNSSNTALVTSSKKSKRDERKAEEEDIAKHIQIEAGRALKLVQKQLANQEKKDRKVKEKPSEKEGKNLEAEKEITKENENREKEKRQRGRRR